MASFAEAQVSPGSDPIAESAAPYGGPLLSPGTISSGSSSPSTPGAPPPTTTVCASGSPCVVTGQYNRYRSSVNLAETQLGSMTDFTYFAPINFFPLDASDIPSSSFTFNPVMAQPLYLTGVTIRGTAYNVLLVSTLNGTVYAFDADQGTILWKRTASTALYKNRTGTLQQVFTNSQFTTFGRGVTTLPYYGAVSTPVVDIVPTTPVMYVVAACATSSSASTYSWFLNALDVTIGNDLYAGGYPIPKSDTFTPENQLQRPSLLLNHVNNGGGHYSTYVYVGFGTGVYELSGSYTYHGAVFGYNVTYSPFSIADLTGNPFTTSSDTQTTSIFPPNAGPPTCTGLACYYGDNSIGNGGAIWQSGKGLAADASANVFFGSSNGAFDCTSTGIGQTSCTDATSVKSWGQSVVKLPAPLSGALGSPTDFFTPNRYTYRNESGSAKAPYQFEELNRYDLDFGTPGVVLFQKAAGTQTNIYAVTADKTGFVYLLPANNGNGLGQFQSGDAGLTSGTSQTQLSFQASTNPPSGGSTTVCPYRNPLDANHFVDHPCDQINELAFWNDLLFVWPWNETVRIFQGTLGPPVGSTYTYSFGTTPAFTGTSGAGYPGGIMALAANAGTSATLWAALTIPGSDDETHHYNGTLYAYTVQTSPVGLTAKWDSSMTPNSACNPPTVSVSSWQVSPFAEPTLANGKVYLPVFKATSGSSTVSGILVFGTCTR